RRATAAPCPAGGWRGSRPTWRPSGCTRASANIRVCPADRVLDGDVVMPPKGGQHHDPRQAARCAERTAVAAVDRGLAGEWAECAGLLRSVRTVPSELLCLASGTAAARCGATGVRARARRR